jgi:hypothetical protein
MQLWGLVYAIFAFPQRGVCHCMFAGVSFPPCFRALMWSQRRNQGRRPAWIRLLGRDASIGMPGELPSFAECVLASRAHNQCSTSRYGHGSGSNWSEGGDCGMSATLPMWNSDSCRRSTWHRELSRAVFGSLQASCGSGQPNEPGLSGRYRNGRISAKMIGICIRTLSADCVPGALDHKSRPHSFFSRLPFSSVRIH